MSIILKKISKLNKSLKKVFKVLFSNQIRLAYLQLLTLLHIVGNFFIDLYTNGGCKQCCLKKATNFPLNNHSSKLLKIGSTLYY